MPAPLVGQMSVMRSFQWRYDRARLILRSPERFRGRRRSQYADAPIRRFLAFLRLWDSLPEEHRNELAELEFPHQTAAYRLSLDPNEIATHHLQARLLAQQDNDTIAKQYGTDPEVIECYEQMFFNVRDRFACRDWLVRGILLSEPPFPIDVVPYVDATTFKLFALFLGPVAVDGLLAGINFERHVQGQFDLPVFMEDNFAHVVMQRGFAAGRIGKVTPKTAMRCLELCGRLVESSRQAKAAGAGSNTSISAALERNIELILSQIEPTVGVLPTNSPLLLTASPHVMLRDHEIESGTVPDDLPSADLRWAIKNEQTGA